MICGAAAAALMRMQRMAPQDAALPNEQGITHGGGKN